ncbi:MAG: NAD(P)-dependent oxidoreductase [Rhodobacteraceae bacterium]|nr:NAD(P)-dependent oxidoreductase [Paracoccaceae bacterium]
MNLGTCLEHGESGGLRPNSLYAATKVAAASIISYCCEQNHSAAITLKAPMIYGPGENRPGWSGC